MAIDSRAKRSAAAGVARPFMRGLTPSSLDAAQRASVGLTYPVVLEIIISAVTLAKVSMWANGVQVFDSKPLLQQLSYEDLIDIVNYVLSAETVVYQEQSAEAEYP